ncbi:MAG: hypothetical protein JWQ13_1571 [Ramlibacter sp.]|jgi:hypothetical protein|nr:hypothetical protein [Ramlibacter sp.]
MPKAPLSDPDADRPDARFDAAFASALRMKARLTGVRPHRAFARVEFTPAMLARATVLPLVLCGLLWHYREHLYGFWQACMTFWAVRLELPLALLPGPHGRTMFMPLASLGPAEAAGGTAPWLILGGSVLAYALSYRLRRAAYPLRFPLRIVCVILVVSVLVFWLWPGLFPRNSAQHGEQLLSMGWALILASPGMLGMGYFLMHQNLLKMLGNTALLLLFLALMVPHQVVLHVLILSKLSLLFMPLLYFVFGAIFDALVFVALYAWVVSNVPVQTTL